VCPSALAAIAVTKPGGRTRSRVPPCATWRGSVGMGHHVNKLSRAVASGAQANLDSDNLSDNRDEQQRPSADYQRPQNRPGRSRYPAFTTRCVACFGTKTSWVESHQPTAQPGALASGLSRSGVTTEGPHLAPLCVKTRRRGRF
jgi:hypothetical protein